MKGWETKTIDQMSMNLDSKRIPIAKSRRVSGEYPYYGASGIVDYVENFIFDGDALLVSEDGANLLARATPIAFPVSGRCWVNNHAHILKFDCLTTQRFVELYLESIPLDEYITGAAQPKLNQKVLNSIPIPIPPLPEQRRIVGILDEAFAAIATARANAETNLQNARALFESHLDAVFSQRGEGWAVRKVSDIADHSLGKMLDKAKNKGELRPYLRNFNVRWFAFDLSDVLQMPFLPAEEGKYTVVKGDVLICEGGYPGRAAIWGENYPIHFQKALHRVRFHESEHGKWFVYYLYAQDASGELKRHFSGAGIQHFTGQALARFELPLAPLPELRRAVTGFDQLFERTRRLESIYERKLAALDELKKSLLHQAFAGEL